MIEIKRGWHLLRAISSNEESNVVSENPFHRNLEEVVPSISLIYTTVIQLARTGIAGLSSTFSTIPMAGTADRPSWSS